MTVGNAGVGRIAGRRAASSAGPGQERDRQRDALARSLHATNIIGTVGIVGAVLVALSTLALSRFASGVAPSIFPAFRSTTRRQLSILALFTGLVCLTAAWWFLRRAHGRRRWLFLASWLIPLLLALPVISSDLYNYAEQGWALLHGADPTIVPAGTVPGPFRAWAGYWVGTTVRYPQVGLALTALSALVGGGNQYLTLILLRVWPLLGLLILVGSVKALSPRGVGSPDDRAWLAVANPVILIHGITDGHSDLLAIALVLAGVAWFDKRFGRDSKTWVRWSAAAMLWLAGALIKPTALVFLAAIPWMHRSRPVGRMARFIRLIASGAVLTVAIAVTVGVTAVLPGGLHWLSGTGDPGTTTNSAPRLIQRIVFPRGEAIGAPQGPLSVASLIVPASVLLTLVFVAVVVVKFDVTNPWFIVLVLLTGLALLGPASRPWYFLGCAPCLALVTRRDRRVSFFWVAFLLWSLLQFPTLPVSSLVLSLVPWAAIAVIVLVARLEAISKAVTAVPADLP